MAFKIYINQKELGSAYRMNDGVLEFAPMMQDGTFDIAVFGPVEPELIGDELATFNGNEKEFNYIFQEIENILI